MKKHTIIPVILLSLVTSPIFSQSNENLDKFFRLSNFYFKRYVHEGLVNYQYANSNSSEIEVMHKLIESVDLTGSSEAVRKAFCINAYNLLVIYQVAKSYPIKNPLDEEGFFDKKVHRVAGKDLTLNQLEFQQMFGNFKDSRFHFVLACAAKSCPKLANYAYQPSNVEQLLEERTKLAMNDDSFIRVDPVKNKVSVSKIFEWYQKDFKEEGQSILDYINKYRSMKIPSNYSVEYYEYDWSLNERKS